MSSSHDHEGVPDHGSAFTAGLFVCSFLPGFFHHIHLTRMPSPMQRLAQQGTGGSVVEFSLTRREARDQFPPVRFSLIWIGKNVNDRNDELHSAGQKGDSFVILFLGRTVYFASNSVYLYFFTGCMHHKY